MCVNYVLGRQRQKDWMWGQLKPQSEFQSAYTAIPNQRKIKQSKNTQTLLSYEQSLFYWKGIPKLKLTYTELGSSTSHLEWGGVWGLVYKGTSLPWSVGQVDRTINKRTVKVGWAQTPWNSELRIVGLEPTLCLNLLWKPTENHGNQSHSIKFTMLLSYLDRP